MDKSIANNYMVFVFVTTFVRGCFGGIFLAVTCSAVSAAEPLKSATVVEVKNDVFIQKESKEEHSAVPKDVVSGKDIVRTGQKSRAELEFADRSIARLGSNTVFSFDPESRTMEVTRGTALIHVPPGLSGAQIATPAATAAIQGDVVALRVNGQGATQILALSRDARGPVTVTFNRTGETRILEVGQMLTLNPRDLRMPAPSSVNVSLFLKTSMLVKKEAGFSTELPKSAQNEIQKGEAVQQKEIKAGALEASKPALVAAQSLSNGNNLNVSSSSTTIQSAATSTVAGNYTGTFMDVFDQGTVAFTVNRDGTTMGTGHNITNGKTFLIQGVVNTDGSFRFVNSEGTPVTGKLSVNGSQATGTVVIDHQSSGTTTATLSLSKTP